MFVSSVILFSLNFIFEDMYLFSSLHSFLFAFLIWTMRIDSNFDCISWYYYQSIFVLFFCVNENRTWHWQRQKKMSYLLVAVYSNWLCCFYIFLLTIFVVCPFCSTFASEVRTFFWLWKWKSIFFFCRFNFSDKNKFKTKLYQYK